jgi:transposase
MDLSSLLASVKAVQGHSGRTPIDLRILIALWMFATIEGVSSARRINTLCRRDDCFKWLCGGVSVNYHTLADFRTDHAVWLEEQIVSSVAVLRQENLVDLNRVGQDGMRVRANAGSSSFQREAKLQEHLAQAQEQWDRLQAETQQPDPAPGCRRQQKARLRAAHERLERVQRALQERDKLQAAREARKKGDGPKTRASTTDPEARSMKMADGGYRPAYNVQFATDLDSLVVVGVMVTNVGSDAGQMDPMLEQMQQQGQPTEYFTDGGFSTLQDISKVSKRGVVVYTPVKEVEKKQAKVHNPFEPQKGDTPEVVQWRQRMGTEEGRKAYRQRSKCEWTNAMSRNQGLYRLLVRGLEKVKAVALWHGLAVNFLRTLSLRAAAVCKGIVRAEVAGVCG